MLTQAAIAQATGVSIRAIQLVERRALTKLKAAIESEAERAGMTPGEWLFDGVGTNDTLTLLRAVGRERAEG